MRRIREVVGPGVRCTNVALESFGICVGKPLMNFTDVYRELAKTFGKDAVRYYHNTGEGYLISTDQKPFKKINANRPDHLIEYLKATNTYGHYVLFVQGHAFAYHYLPGTNVVWAVDAEEKFIHRRKIQSVIEVDSPYLDKTFEAFLQNNTRPNKIARL